MEEDVVVKRIVVEGKQYLGVKINLFNVPLLLIKGERGFAMCGYLNVNAADKLGDRAVMVSGVSDFEDMLNAPIKMVSEKLKQEGLREGTVLKDALKYL